MIKHLKSKLLIQLFTWGLFLLSAPQTLAAQYAILAGGVPKTTDETVDYFSDTFIDAKNFLEMNNFKTVLLFGKESGLTPLQTKNLELTKLRPKPFTRSNFLLRLKKLAHDVKSGDQVFFMFDSHGYFCKPRSGDIHFWPTPLEKASTCVLMGDAGEQKYLNLDILKPFLAQVEAKNAKIAILDLSCTSGPALQLGSKNTCVITSVGEGTAHGDFGSSFWKNAKAGKSIEENYLSGLSVERGKDDANISTKAGMTAKQIVLKIHRTASPQVAEPWFENYLVCKIPVSEDQTTKAAKSLVEGQYELLYKQLYLQEAHDPSEACANFYL